MATIALAVTIALIFYLVLPLLGAFSVRKRWRTFRRHIIQGSTYSRLTYSNPKTTDEGYAGQYRFLGSLEAIQNDSDIWVNNGEISVKAELKGEDIYLLPASRSMEAEDRIEKNEELLPEDMPGKLNWEKVYSLAQGTRLFLSGRVYIENGNPVFRNVGEEPLLIMIYDGKKESILRRSIWCGRQKNEYWNPITPVSLLAGSFFLFVIAFLMFRRPDVRVLSYFVAVMSFIPLIPFLPPGVVFYYIYRRLWKRGRILRGERDLLRLPLRIRNCVIKKGISCEKALTEYPGAKLRGSGTIRNGDLLQSECFIFMTASDSDEKSHDPFVEELIIPGDPESLARNSRRRARWMEMAAAFMFILGFVINALIVFQLILWFI